MDLIEKVALACLAIGFGALVVLQIQAKNYFSAVMIGLGGLGMLSVLIHSTFQKTSGS